MSARKEGSFQPSAGDRRLSEEIKADVFEIWVGVSRLMSRLSEPGPGKGSRRPARRRRTTRPEETI
ncbi:MAG TPA: hypothetical protein VNR39_04075 [Pseudolabrys sp.]|nr:hypothetical protein [Pseudolabrys sp.]